MRFLKHLAAAKNPREGTVRTSLDGFGRNCPNPANNYVLDIAASGFQSEHYEDIVVIENNVTNLQKLMLWQE